VAASDDPKLRDVLAVEARHDWLTDEDLSAIGQYHALVIGIDHYQHHPYLSTAVNDARAVAEVLEGAYGFHVTRLLDDQATDAAIREALSTLGAKLSPPDSLLIYFSGHGTKRGRKVGFWIPVNGFENSDANWIVHTEIRSRLSLDVLPARHVLIVADSCYSGVLLKAVAADPEITPRRLREAISKPARQCLTSGGDYPVPDGPKGSHSIFARYFLKELQEPPGQAFVPSDIYPYIMANTAQNAPEVMRGQVQTPILGIVPEADHEEGGQFVFFHRRGGPKIARTFKLKLRSEPTGAEVCIGYQPRGVTPFEAELDIGRSYDLSVSKAGHGAWEYRLARTTPEPVELVAPLHLSKDSRLLIALDFVQRGDTVVATRLLEDLAKSESPDAVRAAAEMVRMRVKDGQMAEARQWATELRRRFPHSAESAEADQALYDQAMASAPTDATILGIRGRIAALKRFLAENHGNVCPPKAEAEMSQLRQRQHELYRAECAAREKVARDFVTLGNFDAARQAADQIESLGRDGHKLDGLGLDDTALARLRGDIAQAERRFQEDEAFQRVQRVALDAEEGKDYAAAIQAYEQFEQAESGKPEPERSRHLPQARQELARHRHAQEAERKRDDADWEVARSRAAELAGQTKWDAAAAVYKAYPVVWPKGGHVGEVPEAIAELQRQRDDAEWQVAHSKAMELRGQAKWKDAMGVCEKYLHAWPKGRHAGEAHRAIQEMEGQWDDAEWRATSSRAAELATQKKWNEATALDEAYLKGRPEGRHAEQARKAIAKLQRQHDDAEWQAACIGAAQLATAEKWKDAVGIYDGYLKARPKGRHADEARKAIGELEGQRDEAAWRIACEGAGRLGAPETWKQAAAAYETYLDAWPQGRHVEEAHKAIAELEARCDGAEWQAARSKAAELVGQSKWEEATALCEGYLAAWPRGRHVGDAHKAITELGCQRDDAEWQAVRGKAAQLAAEAQWNDAAAVYHAYGKGRPTGRHAHEVPEAIAELQRQRDDTEWQVAHSKAMELQGQAKWKEAMGICEEYLHAWPKGSHAEEARKTISELQQQRDDAEWRATCTRARPLATHDKWGTAWALYKAYLGTHPGSRHGDEARRAIDELLRIYAPVPDGFRKAFIPPTEDKDQHGNPVVTRKGSKFDPDTGWPYEIWLHLESVDIEIMEEYEEYEERGWGPWKRKEAVKKRRPVRRTTTPVRMEFVLIPAGEFQMGSPMGERDRYENEGPVHRVRITQASYLAKYETTQAQYEAVTGKNPSDCKGGTNPVEGVSWHDVTGFCKSLSQRVGVEIRLPTEAEWEYACRAGTSTRFSHGDDSDYRKLGEYAWYDGDSGRKMHPVGRKKPNPWGLYDMHGNVWEWCLDGKRSYSSSAERDPKGPEGGLRVLRGGSWGNLPQTLRSANRLDYAPSDTWDLGGCRVLVVVGSPSRFRADEACKAVAELQRQRDDAEWQVAHSKAMEFRGQAKWKEAMGICEEYLHAWPKGSHAEEARKTIAELRDDAAWRAVCTEAGALATQDKWRTARALYKAYLDTHPGSRHGDEVRRAIHELERLYSQLPHGLREAFILPGEDKDQHGNPVVERHGSRLDPETGWPYEIWLCLEAGAIEVMQECEAEEESGWGPWKKTEKVKKQRPVRRTRGRVQMEFVLIPAGEFQMGSPNDEKDRGDNEGPLHRVRITQPFYLAKYQTTQAQYQALTAKDSSHFKGAKNPVECVSWHDVVAFGGTLSQSAGVEIRLPTEAEWEYACRAGTRTRFSYGDDPDHSQVGEYAWYSGNSRRKTHPVGQKKPNPWGLYDMHGNVWEWCSDWYETGYYGKSPADDPRGPTSGSSRVCRGGSWPHNAKFTRSAFRYYYVPTNAYAGIGCRVVVGRARGFR